MVKCSKAEVRRLKTALRWKIPPEQRQRIQMVLLRESGLTQPAIAQAMGVSLSPDRDIKAQNAFKKSGFVLLSGMLGAPRRPAVAVCGSCSPTKRGSAGSTTLGRAGLQRG
jgi:hypothetical protein